MKDYSRITRIVWITAAILLALLVTFTIVFLTIGLVRANQRADSAEAKVDQLVLQNTGPRGEDGLSAYQIAVKDGFVGTEQEWLTSLKGDVGAAGPQGEPGKNGTNGTNGKNGVAGTDGNSSVGSFLTRALCNGTSIDLYSGSTLISRIATVCVR